MADSMVSTTRDEEVKEEESDAGYFDLPEDGKMSAPLDKNLKTKERPETPRRRSSSPKPAPRLNRAGTAPVSGPRPSIDKKSQTEAILRPRKSGTLQLDQDRPRSSQSQQRPKALRAPFSYNYYGDEDDSESSSSSEEEEDTIEPLRTQSSFHDGAAEDQPRPRRPAQRARSYTRIALGNSQYQTDGKVSKKDGRLRISINENVNSGRVAKWLGKNIRNHLDIAHVSTSKRPLKKEDPKHEAQEVKRITESLAKIPKPSLNIVIMVIGSRGDIQPFLRIGQILKKRGHRVRIATHPAFREFVQNDIGLEFFSVGGDPSELMAFMVKNPGLIPSFDTVRHGEIPKRRAAMAEMFEGFWRSCINATDDEKDTANMRMMGERQPYVADAIIANPPSFAHVHIAERLGIPLHMMFTFPYSPTQQFPHPLANIKATSQGNVDPNYVNFMSYALVEMMTWQGLGDLVNSFRVRTLGLEPISSFWAPDALWRMKVPYTYMWSPELIPKPKDWGPEIHVTGFVFLDLASKFEPPTELATFLNAGEPPVYIGFGSIVVDDPDHFTSMIFEAIKLAGVRALVSKGWGGIGGGADVPKNVFMLENTPHDWLFPRCAAVVHHGGAGTTAIGLKCGKPTVIVPFFGDQPFWGAMVADNKAGADRSIPYKKLTAEKLAESIKQCLTDEARENAGRIAKGIEEEGDGAANAVDSFERSLPLAGHHNMRCSILEERVAVWKLKHSNLRLSALAAEILIENRDVRWDQLHLIRHYDYNDFDGPGEPISGMGGAVMRSAHGFGKGIATIPVRMDEHVRRRKEYARREEKKQKRAQQKINAHDIVAQKKAEKRGDIAPNEAEPPPNMRSSVERAEAAQPQRPAGPTTNSTSSTTTTLAEAPKDSLAQELAEDAGSGIRRSVAAVFWAPLDIHLAVAQGFHNAPRLYGDATVRKPRRINGIKSGLLAARNEFCFGLYDGISGLALQPVRGVKTNTGVGKKIGGFWSGVGKGVGGAVLKPTSAFISTPAFIGHGFRKEIQRRSKGPMSRGDAWVRRAHIIQGQKDLKALQDADDSEEKLKDARGRVANGWRVMTEVWAAAAKHKEHGGRIVGQWQNRQERKKWERAGALENVSATEKALDKAKDRKDLQKFFNKREKEMRVADQPQGAEEFKVGSPDVGEADDPMLHGTGLGADKGYGDVGGEKEGEDTDSTKVGSLDLGGGGQRGVEMKVEGEGQVDGPAGTVRPGQTVTAA